MNIILEVHHYAPELNRAYLNGNAQAVVKCPGIFTIKDFRARFFKPVKRGLFAVVAKEYDDPRYTWLNKTYSGYVSSRAEALALVRDMKPGTGAGKPLVNGEIMPAPKFTIEFRIIGGR